MSRGGLRVLLYHAADDARALEAAYHEVSAELAQVEGLEGNELLRSVHDPSGFVVASTWRDLAAFETWEQGSAHRPTTAPLRPYRDTRLAQPFGIYRVMAAY